MAHRIITQVIITGTRVLGRALTEAYKQASASQHYTRRPDPSGSPGGGADYISAGLSVDEACKILNVRPTRGVDTDMEHVMERFKTLFDKNDPKQGGSFYLQSKVLRARERIELEVKTAQEWAGYDRELREGWRPKVLKNR